MLHEKSSSFIFLLFEIFLNCIKLKNYVNLLATFQCVLYVIQVENLRRPNSQYY